MLKLVFKHFDTVILYLDDKLIEVTDDVVLLDIDSNPHSIRVYNSGAKTIDSFSAIGLMPEVSFFTDSATQKIVNHLIGWRMNFSLCVWEGTVRSHRDAEISFICRRMEYHNFLQICASRMTIQAISKNNVKLSYVCDDGYVRLNNKQSALWFLSNFLPLVVLCTIYSFCGFFSFTNALTDQTMLRRSVFLVLGMCLGIYGIGKFVFYLARLVCEVKFLSKK